MRTMRRTAVLALLLAVGGCGSGLAPRSFATAPSTVLLPLAVGNEWTYEVRYPAGDVAMLTMRVRGERYIESRGMRATIVEERGGIPGRAFAEVGTDLVAYYLRGGFVFRSAWLVARDAGLEDRGAELGDERLLPLDPVRDVAWEGGYGLFDFGSRVLYQFHASSRLAPASEAVSVPAGVFDRCVRIDTRVAATTPHAPTDRTIVHRYVEWYAPRVGLVKSQSFVDGTLEVGRADLVRFRVNDGS